MCAAFSLTGNEVILGPRFSSLFICSTISFPWRRVLPGVIRDLWKSSSDLMSTRLLACRLQTVWVRCFEEDQEQLHFVSLSCFCLFCILPLRLIFSVLPKATPSSRSFMGHGYRALQTLRAVFWSEPSEHLVRDNNNS